MFILRDPHRVLRNTQGSLVRLPATGQDMAPPPSRPDLIPDTAVFYVLARFSGLDYRDGVLWPPVLAQSRSLWSVNPVLPSLNSVIILLTEDLHYFAQAVFIIVIIDLQRRLISSMSNHQLYI